MPENLRCKQAVALSEKPFVISGLMFRSLQSKALGASHVFIYNHLLFVFKLAVLVGNQGLEMHFIKSRSDFFFFSEYW